MDLDGMFDVYDFEDEGPVCRDCAARCDVALPVGCTVSWCTHACKRLGDVDADRARALDDRDHAALENVARDVEAESRPSLTELLAERFGRPTRGAA
jgi:hypothetical protein